MSLGKQISTLFVAAILLGLGARVTTKSDLPFWGFWQPIELVAPKLSLADEAISAPVDSAFAVSDKPYEVNLATTMVPLYEAQKGQCAFCGCA
ncbi:MAG: hypothetical protein IPK53_01170 [bacterium]|nr:hypothetical protein [bacterium]